MDQLDDDVNVKSDLTLAVQDLSLIAADPPKMRENCPRCGRPLAVCWCPYLPTSPLLISSTLIILQHPCEQKRNLKTAPMLEAALPRTKCFIFKGRRFSPGTNPALRSLLAAPNTILLYPGPKAVPLETLEPVPLRGSPYNIVILDGTWSQARSIYRGSETLQRLPQVQIAAPDLSKYVIRTQPNDRCLSTVETGALALAFLEDMPHLQEVLVKPLVALCQFQLEHGAVTHDSKEHRL